MTCDTKSLECTEKLRGLSELLVTYAVGHDYSMTLKPQHKYTMYMNPYYHYLNCLSLTTVMGVLLPVSVVPGQKARERQSSSPGRSIYIPYKLLKNDKESKIP